MQDRTLAAQHSSFSFFDATFGKARVLHHIASLVVGVVEDAVEGRWEALGFDVGDSEKDGVWTSYLRSLEFRYPAG